MLQARSFWLSLFMGDTVKYKTLRNDDIELLFNLSRVYFSANIFA